MVRVRRGVVVLILMIFLVREAYSLEVRGYSEVRSYSHPYYSCFEGAARFYGVSEWLLWAIAKVESGFNPRAVNRNRDGSRDLGLMQINTRWIPELKRLGFIRGEADLFDPCTSIYAGAYILRKCVNEFGYTWDAVGCYHSRTKWRKNWYARKVYMVIVKNMERSIQQELRN